MCIGRYREIDAVRGGLPAVRIGEIEAVGLAVDFEADAVLPACVEHVVPVALYRIAFAYDTSARVAYAVHHAARYGDQQPLRHLFLCLVAMVVDARNDPVQPGEELLVDIERAVFEDVHFDACKQPEPLEESIDIAYVVGMLSQSISVQTVSVATYDGELHAQVWTAQVGRCRLLLLDT